MSLVHTHSRTKKSVILDFSQSNKVSRRSITQSLRQLKLNKESDNTYYDQEIIIGAYKIKLRLGINTWSRNISLRECRTFGADIYEYDSASNTWKDVYYYNNKMFKNQDWIMKTFYSELYIKDLIDIICYCYRLNKIYIFS